MKIAIPKFTIPEDLLCLSSFFAMIFKFIRLCATILFNLFVLVIIYTPAPESNLSSVYLFISLILSPFELMAFKWADEDGGLW